MMDENLNTKLKGFNFTTRNSSVAQAPKSFQRANDKLSEIQSQSKETQTSRETERMAFGQGLFGPSRPTVQSSKEGTTITGGDSNSYSYDNIPSSNNSFVNNSKSSTSEALDEGNKKIARSANSPLTINDSSEAHQNHHVADSTQGSPLTLNTGNSDGDTYNVSAQAGSTTNINGAGQRGTSTNAPKDVINFHPHLASPGDKAKINLTNFNPSKTDLKINGKSLFGETNTNYSGSINFSRDDDNGTPKIQLELKSTNE